MTLNQAMISTTTLTSTSALVSIPVPSGYTDLRLVVSGRLTGGDVNVKLYFNSDTTSSNYANTRLFGDGLSVSSDASTASQIAFATNISSYTAASYGSAEIYIPNYSVNGIKKSYSSDNITESNANSGVYVTTASALWQGTAPITSLNLVPNSGSFVAGSSFTLYGISKLGVTPTQTPKATGGDIIVNDGTYWYHAFLSTGAFIPQVNLTCDYLVVAGGGGGGDGGGGGAGGLRSTVTATGGGGSLESQLSLTSGTIYTAIIGAGGGSGGTNGNNSTFASITATAGGGGAYTPRSNNGLTGGSGGGAYSSGTGGAGTANQGYAGGNGNGITAGGAGGGGAGSVGLAATGGGATGGTGGSGVSIPSFASATSTGVSNYYAGGGGGAGGSTGGTGGGGGAGNGGAAPNYTGTSAVANTGSGGGCVHGNGGSGIVIIRYAMA